MLQVDPQLRWNPLDEGPIEEWIPDRWIGPHVGLRLTDAFRTLALMPLQGMSTKSGFWPEYLHDMADLNSQEQSDLQLKQDRANEQNRSRIQPTAQQISRMMTALWWAGTYLKLVEHCRVVNRVAFLRARELEIDQISRRMRMNVLMLRKVNREALDRIAIGLRRDRIEVF